MKRLGLVLAFVLGALPVHAQIIKQSTATTVNIKLTKIADGTDHTGLGVTSITLKFIKHSNTLSATHTAVTCAAASSSNDCVEVGFGVYNVELSATDTNTLGRLEVCALASGDYTDCRGFQVVAAATYAINVEGNVTDGAEILTDLAAVQASVDLLDTAPRGIAYSNFPIWIMSNSTGAGVASLSNITCRVKKDGGAWATTNDTSESEVGGAGNGRGAYLIDLTAAEMTADTVGVECVSATANTSVYRTNITTQH